MVFRWKNRTSHGITSASFVNCSLSWRANGTRGTVGADLNQGELGCLKNWLVLNPHLVTHLVKWSSIDLIWLTKHNTKEDKLRFLYWHHLWGQMWRLLIAQLYTLSIVTRGFQPNWSSSFNSTLERPKWPACTWIVNATFVFLSKKNVPKIFPKKNWWLHSVSNPWVKSLFMSSCTMRSGDVNQLSPGLQVERNAAKGLF